MSRFTDGVENLTPLPKFDNEWEKGVPYLFGDIAIVIEYFAGDERIKTSDSGFVVRGIMPTAYGEILGTTDIHGEKIDMYLAMMPDEDANIYVIDQINPGSGQFDEHKIMLGFGSPEEVIHTYSEVFSDGSWKKRLGALTTFSRESFLAWLSLEGATLKPAQDYAAGDVTSEAIAGIAPTVKPTATMPAPRDNGGGVQIELVDLSKGPVIKTLSGENGGFDYHVYLYTAIDITLWSNAFDTLVRILDLAKETDRVHIHIASPGGSVILMGRVVSAIRKTKACVCTYAEGSVASAATSIWAAGHKRHILPGAFFMQHMSSQALSGKTTDIVAKAAFCKEYIEAHLQEFVRIGLFTEQEVSDMVTKSSDIFISGREAIARMGVVSVRS